MKYIPGQKILAAGIIVSGHLCLIISGNMYSFSSS